MSSQFSLEHPVETIISGPAASILAGKACAEDKDYLIVDMGGTTTDVSVVRDNRPVIAENGIHIGPWRTSVNGVFVDTFGLGGDSAVRLKDGVLSLSNRRVMSVCSAAVRWPQVKEMLAKLIEKKHINKFPLHEFFYLVKEPQSNKNYDKYEMQLIDALREGPVLLEELKERANIDIYHFKSERLESEGVIMRCGLTPTDFMHIIGDYTEFDVEASVLAARYILLSMRRDDTKEELIKLSHEVYDLVEGFMYKNLVRILLTQQFPKQFADGLDSQTEHLITESWKNRNNTDTPMFKYNFGTGASLIGIGAPTHVFLPEVAKALGTKCIIPEHAEVANAIGALRADIIAVVNVDISQRVSPGGEMYYIVHAPGGSMRFYDSRKAVLAAKQAACEAVIAEAKKRGAAGELTPRTYIRGHDPDDENLSLGGTVVAEVSSAVL